MSISEAREHGVRRDSVLLQSGCGGLWSTRPPALSGTGSGAHTAESTGCEGWQAGDLGGGAGKTVVWVTIHSAFPILQTEAMPDDCALRVKASFFSEQELRAVNFLVTPCSEEHVYIEGKSL